MTTIEGTIDESQTQENGQEGINWEQKYKELLPDYTRKSQELSEYKKQPAEQTGADDEVLKSWLKDNGFVSKDELAMLRKRDQDDNELTEIISNNPDLKKHEKAIRELSEKTGLSNYAIIDDYSFGQSDKLKKAKERKLLSDRDYGKGEETPLKDMSNEAYADWKAKNVVNNPYKAGDSNSF